MQNKLESRSDYKLEEIGPKYIDSIFDNPINLLKVKKERSQNFQDKLYEISIIKEAFSAMFSVIQKDKENLQDYNRRFKTAKDVLESHLGGPIYLDKFITGIPGWMAGGHVEKFSKEAGEQFMSYLNLVNSDQEKYGSIQRNLIQQYSLGSD